MAMLNSCLIETNFRCLLLIDHLVLAAASKKGKLPFLDSDSSSLASSVKGIPLCGLYH